MAGKHEEEDASQHEGEREHPQAGRQERQVEEAEIGVSAGRRDGHNASLVAEPSGFALKEEKPQDPDGQHRPQEKPDADQVSGVDHRSDQDLGQPEHEENPVVAGLLGQEVPDELKIDKPVPQRVNWLALVGSPFDEEDSQGAQGEDVGDVAGNSPLFAPVDHEEGNDSSHGHDDRQEPVEPRVGRFAAENRGCRREHHVKAGSVDQVAVHGDGSLLGTSRRRSRTGGFSGRDALPRRTRQCGGVPPGS